jgi:large-conductance mechanosensitive channel
MILIQEANSEKAKFSKIQMKMKKILKINFKLNLLLKNIVNILLFRIFYKIKIKNSLNL